MSECNVMELVNERDNLRHSNAMLREALRTSKRFLETLKSSEDFTDLLKAENARTNRYRTMSVINSALED